MVAIPGNDLPVTTPVAGARRTRETTATLLLLGVLSFASVSVLPWPGPEQPSEDRSCRAILLTSDDHRFLLTNDNGTALLTADQPSCDPIH